MYLAVDMSTLLAQRTFFRIFPPPRYLLMPSSGIDVSDEAVKFIDLEATSAGIRVKQYATIEIPKGAIVRGEIKQPEPVVEALRTLHIEYGVSFAHASLPQEHAYLFQTSLAQDTPDKQVKTAIEFKLKENIPLAPEEVLFDFQPIVTDEDTGRGRLYAVAAYPREIIESYLAVFAEADITLVSLETEGEANTRAVIPPGEGTYMLVDIGRAGTEVSIIYRGHVLSTASVDVCGQTFTEAVKRFMQVTTVDAEQIKSERGFIKSNENQELFEALLSPVSDLRDAINKQLTYWNMHHGTQYITHYDIAEIIFSGGGSNLKGLVEYFSATMSLPVSQANVWLNVFSFDDYVPPLPRVASMSYATAVGLSLKSLS